MQSTHWIAPSGSSKADDNSPSPIGWERAGVRVRTVSQCMLTAEYGKEVTAMTREKTLKLTSLSSCAG